MIVEFKLDGESCFAFYYHERVLARKGLDLLMTATVVSLALSSMALSSLPGAEVQRPLATVVNRWIDYSYGADFGRCWCWRLIYFTCPS